jgi:hypothetical protein
VKHRWYASKWSSGWSCSTCRVHDWSVEKPDGGECGAASHSDPAINKLYRERRKAAEAADESGFKGMRGWDDLAKVESELRKVDPDGDWRFEGNRHDGRGWRVERR